MSTRGDNLMGDDESWADVHETGSVISARSKQLADEAVDELFGDMGEGKLPNTDEPKTNEQPAPVAEEYDVQCIQEAKAMPIEEKTDTPAQQNAPIKLARAVSVLGLEETSRRIKLCREPSKEIEVSKQPPALSRRPKMIPGVRDQKIRIPAQRELFPFRQIPEDEAKEVFAKISASKVGVREREQKERAEQTAMREAERKASEPKPVVHMSFALYKRKVMHEQKISEHAAETVARRTYMSAASIVN